MKFTIILPVKIQKTIQKYFFSSKLEQGAALFAQERWQNGNLILEVQDYYLVPKSGWEVQQDIYLQMKDSERAKILKMAIDKGLCLIDCHSHTGIFNKAFFSYSDISGITEFASYVKWKLNGKPFAAMVWSKGSLDSVLFQDEFNEAHQVDEIRVSNGIIKIIHPTRSWRDLNYWSMQNE
ncbi:MAG: hypothetical protein GPJ54_01855 [Candidatus Heimdallarchaeota archaeon]|nr:hypothetical protein [Candidatus Heimdallarchaeota archaeon]